MQSLSKLESLIKDAEIREKNSSSRSTKYSDYSPRKNYDRSHSSRYEKDGRHDGRYKFSSDRERSKPFMKPLDNEVAYTKHQEDKSKLSSAKDSQSGRYKSFIKPSDDKQDDKFMDTQRNIRHRESSSSSYHQSSKSSGWRKREDKIDERYTAQSAYVFYCSYKVFYY